MGQAALYGNFRGVDYAKSHDCAPPHEQAALIRQKRAIYAQLREFGESYLAHLYEKTSQTKVREAKNTKMLLQVGH